MLGAVAGFLTILIARLERVADKNKALRLSDKNIDPTGAVAASFMQRMELLSRAILFAVLSALVTAALLIAAFSRRSWASATGRSVAMMLAVALMLLMASLVQLAREIRVYMKHMHLE